MTTFSTTERPRGPVRTVGVAFILTSLGVLGMTSGAVQTSGGVVVAPSPRTLEVAYDRAATAAELAESERASGIDPSSPMNERLVASGADRVTTTGTSTPALSRIVVASGIPALSSRPGSTRTIYLDFAGGRESATAWSSSAVTVRPYDLDGRPTTTNARERAVVTEVYRRVVEDFAAFDVNVTTVAPSADQLNRTSAGDSRYGVTAVVSGETFYAATCGCGGAAYTGVFDLVGSDRYNEAWVFTRAVGRGAKNIAETVSHEVGHTLGLSHDGTTRASYYGGHGVWAPIMGSSFSRPVTQFSRGEYAGSNNRQDDLSIIVHGGLTRRRDDVSGLRGAATAVRANTTRSSVIGSSADVDYFRVVLSRRATRVIVTTAPVGANLDVTLQVTDGRGRVIATARPAVSATSASTATGLGATVSFTPQAAGTYYVRVAGSGFGSARTSGYSSYGSIGAYAVRVAQ